MTPAPVSVALVAYNGFSPFHFSIPYMVFTIELPNQRLFDLKIVTADGKPLAAERALVLQPDAGYEAIETADLVIVPGWLNLDEAPDAGLIAALHSAHSRGAYVAGLCYGAYALAYAGLLDGKKTATHWMAEQDFMGRFPNVLLDTNLLYVEDQRIITSAGTAASLDCCLFLVRTFYGAQIANKIARIMVMPPHREGGQAQFIEHPVAESTKDARINLLLDYIRENLAIHHTIDTLAERIAMSRRSFTRHFTKATGMSFGEWLLAERLKRVQQLLEATSLSIEQIAEATGFQTALTLRQHFKQHFHVTPRDWRRTFRVDKN